MKIYIINIMVSNVLDLEQEVFIDYNKAITKWAKYEKEALEEIAEIKKEGQDPEEEIFILSEENKSITYDDGQRYCFLSFNTYEAD